SQQLRIDPQNFIRLIEQRKRRKNRGGFAEFQMQRGLAAPQSGIVHARQIVENQRTCVQKFQRRGRRKRRLDIFGHHARGKQRQKRTNAFTPRKQRSLDRLRNTAGAPSRAARQLRSKPAFHSFEKRGKRLYGNR